MYLGGAISESAGLDIEAKRRIGAAWAGVRKYSSQLYDRRNARLSLKIRLFKAEVMEAMLYGCATWTMRSQDFSSLRTAHHKLLLSIIGFRRKDRTEDKPLSYRKVLERTGSERIETTIRKRQLGFAGALVRQGEQGFQSKSCLGGWRCKGPSEEVDRRRRGWTASRKILRPSGRSCTKAKDGSGSHSELLPRMDGIGRLLRRTWASGTGGSRGERKHSTAPGDARTFVNSTCSASARLVKLYSNYVCGFV